jgi:D-alanyl-D-alanine carboxypeptidase
MKKTLLFPVFLLLMLLTPPTLLAQSGISYLNSDFSLQAGKLGKKQAFTKENRLLAGSTRNTDPVLDSILMDILGNYRQNLGVKGLAAAIAFPDGSSWSGENGYSSIENGDTSFLNPDMRFGIGSVTKMLTAACMMTLVEDGLLSLEDTLGQWLPAYDQVDPGITIRQLLNHTSGIYNYTANTEFADEVNANLGKVWEPEEVLTDYLEAPYFSPGQNWAYSNSNYLLAGLIIEEATGTDYHLAVKERLLDPLGLESVKLFPQEEPGPIAHLYIDLFGTGTTIDVVALGLPLEALFSAAWAAGGYYSTPTEMASFVKALYGGDLLSQSSLDEMQTLVPYPAFLDGYGLGTMFDEFMDKTGWGHGGDIAYSSAVFYIPELDIGLAVHCHDSEIGSSSLNPVFRALAQAYCDYQEAVAVNTPGLPEADVRLFPNPTSDNIQIELKLETPSSIAFNLWNLKGQILPWREFRNLNEGSHLVELPLPNLPNGQYFLQINIGTQTLTKEVLLYR